MAAAESGFQFQQHEGQPAAFPQGSGSQTHRGPSLRTETPPLPHPGLGVGEGVGLSGPPSLRGVVSVLEGGRSARPGLSGANLVPSSPPPPPLWVAAVSHGPEALPLW